MIFAEKIEDDPPAWGLRIDREEEPSVVVFDHDTALRIIFLWNNDERDRYDKYQNMLALERKPDQ